MNLILPDYEKFLDEAYPVDVGAWKYHFHAMFSSYCVKSRGCSGIVRPGENYYYNRAAKLTIHVSCAKRWYREEKGAEDAHI